MNIPSKYKIWKYPLLMKIKHWLCRIENRDAICLTYWFGYRPYSWETKVKPFNWGDYVNPILANMISGREIVPSVFYSFAPKIAMVGSILPWAMDKDTIVWGSGCLNSHDPLWENVEQPMKVCAVRGPLTRKVLVEHGVKCPEVYGDPVLCLPRLYQPHIEKKNRIALIPHFTCVEQAIELSKKIQNEVILIDPTKFNKWHEFVDKILSCKLVFSSSLHGLIVADAYGVPNVWVSFDKQTHPDNNFKFHDYFLSVEKDIDYPINITDLDFDNIEKYVRAWKKPHIDIDKLLEACPIK